jgi:hypothetical protein
MEVSLDCQQPLPNPARDLGKAKLKSGNKKKKKKQKDSRKINEELKERTRLREDGKWREECMRRRERSVKKQVKGLTVKDVEWIL